MPRAAVGEGTDQTLELRAPPPGYPIRHDDPRAGSWTRRPRGKARKEPSTAEVTQRSWLQPSLGLARKTTSWT